MFSRILKFGRLCFFLLAASSFAQNNEPKQFIYSDDWTYDFIEYWINNGTYQETFVLNQPYTLNHIREKLDFKGKWQQLIDTHYQQHYGQNGFGKLILYGRDNFSIVSNSDLPVRRGEQAAPVTDIALFKNRTKNHYNFAAQFNLMLPHFSLVNRTVINSELKDDPLFMGDTHEWIFGRINDAYLNINAGHFDFFMGRIDRNWGALATPGLILSDNPYSYDHAQLSYTAKKFKFSMILTRLEDLRALTDLNPDSLFESRKFLTAHRFEFSPSGKFQFALTEVGVYGGPDRDFEFGFMNPMNYFYLIQRNNLQEISGLWAIDLFYKPHQKVDTYLQFLVDDIVVNNEPGQDDRKQFPDRLGLQLKVSFADIWAEGLQTSMEYVRIGNRTYQSRRTFENFHYREKSLGYPRSSTERIGIDVKYFNLYPALLKVHASWQRSGDVQTTDYFPLKKEKFPIGVVEKKWEVGFDLKYFPNYWSLFTVNLGYENFDNYKNRQGDNQSNFKLILGLHVNLAFALKVD